MKGDEIVGRIVINDTYLIDVDQYNFCVKKFYGMIKDKEGNDIESVSVEGYFSTLENALKHLHRLFLVEKINKKEKVSLEELRNMILETKKDIKKINDKLDI
jgi:high-affinity Fe2+/Pb2+ permease